MYHERWLPAIVAALKIGVRLRSIEGVIAATQEALGDGQQAPSSGAVIGLVMPAAGNYQANCDFGNKLAGPSTGRELHDVVLERIETWSDVQVSRPPSCLDFLTLQERGLRDCFTLIKYAV